MKITLHAIFALFFLVPAVGQIDSVATESQLLNASQLELGSKMYLVYLQDSINGPQYNVEIWQRELQKSDATGDYTLQWQRNKDVKGNHYAYVITFDSAFNPFSEAVVHHEKNGETRSVEKKFFTYENDAIYSSADTTLHNAAPFHRDDPDHSLNWELDMEVLSSLPLSEGAAFAINFYHPGSKTAPRYYTYAVDRSEVLTFNTQEFECWVVKVAYSAHQSCEFWIDQSTHTVLQAKEQFFGKYRFKKRVI